MADKKKYEKCQFIKRKKGRTENIKKKVIHVICGLISKKIIFMIFLDNETFGEHSVLIWVWSKKSRDDI